MNHRWITIILVLFVGSMCGAGCVAQGSQREAQGVVVEIPASDAVSGWWSVVDLEGNEIRELSRQKDDFKRFRLLNEQMLRFSPSRDFVESQSAHLKKVQGFGSFLWDGDRGPSALSDTAINELSTASISDLVVRDVAAHEEARPAKQAEEHGEPKPPTPPKQPPADKEATPPKEGKRAATAAA